MEETRVPLQFRWPTWLPPLSRFVVEGDSMLPTHRPGERLLVNRLAYVARAPRPGDVVVLVDPRSPWRRLLKRVAAAEQDRYTVVGDNPAASTDSRHFGPVTRAHILGKVLCRY